MNTYWLIEIPQHMVLENGIVSYRIAWLGTNSEANPNESMPYLQWVHDAQEAIHFPRKADAEAVRRLYWNMPSDSIITEHEDVASPPIPAQEVRPEVIAARCALRMAEAGHIKGEPSIEWWTQVFSEVIGSYRQESVPGGWRLVPAEPTEEMWCGLARRIIQWLEFNERHTPASLFEHLEAGGDGEIPKWLQDEPEMSNAHHSISKGQRAVLIYKAMLAASPDSPLREGVRSEARRTD